jgi:hypothetical protein
VPARTLRAWDAAETQLFPLIMARPDLYERALSLIQLVLIWLRASCPDVPALLAQAARGDAIVAEAGGLRPDQRAGRAGLGPVGGPLARHPGGEGPDAPDTAGLRLDLIAAAACAMRYRELAAAGAAANRLSAFARARVAGSGWAVIEEAGDQARVPFLPYQRVEAHIPSGRAVIISIEPDETLVRPVWRLDEAVLDPASGRLRVGAEIGSYASAGDFDAALASARQRLG